MGFLLGHSAWRIDQFPTCWPMNGLSVHWSRGWGVSSFSERLVHRSFSDSMCLISKGWKNMLTSALSHSYFRISSQIEGELQITAICVSFSIDKQSDVTMHVDVVTSRDRLEYWLDGQMMVTPPLGVSRVSALVSYYTTSLVLIPLWKPFYSCFLYTNCSLKNLSQPWPYTSTAILTTWLHGVFWKKIYSYTLRAAQTYFFCIFLWRLFTVWTTSHFHLFLSAFFSEEFATGFISHNSYPNYFSVTHYLKTY